MDHLLECAEAFEQLLDVQYHIVLGRKNRLTELTLRFDPTEFHHLVGLHKLRDLRLARGNREKIFYQILSKTICMEDIKKSRYFPEIQDRMFFFDKIEYLLDSNKTVFLQVLLSIKYDVGVKRYFDPSDTELLRALHSRNSKNIRNPLIFLQKMASYSCFWRVPSSKILLQASLHRIYDLLTLVSYYQKMKNRMRK